MCRHAAYDVPPEPWSVPHARGFCRDTLAGWGLDMMAADTLVVLSEFVTNGVLHAGTPLRVNVSAADGRIEVAVSDGSRVVPAVRPRRDDLRGDLDAILADLSADRVADDRDPRLDVGAAGSVVGGRGLQLVASLAEDWGVDLAGPGKSVWARLPIPAGWPPAAECGCASGTTRLSSGRTVLPQ